jgi:hypothetical protein
MRKAKPNQRIILLLPRKRAKKAHEIPHLALAVTKSHQKCTPLLSELSKPTDKISELAPGQPFFAIKEH